MGEKDEDIEVYGKNKVSVALQYAYVLAEEGNSPIVEGAYVTCNQSISNFPGEPVMVYAGVENYNKCNGASGLKESDIVLRPEAFGVCKVTREACQPEIEGKKWQECDLTNSLNGEPDVTMNSYMVCLIGGIIAPLTDGQRIEELMEQNFMEYVTLEQLKQLGWYKPDEKLALELNRLLEKYDITTTERIRHFLAQCMKETSRGMWLREGEDRKFESQEDYETFYNTKRLYGYKYRGSGHIQLTGDYHYLAFATYMIQQEYPELHIIWESPAHHSGEEMWENYDRAVQKAREAGKDIEKYEKIVSEGADYVAEEYAWETAGYFWDIGNCNSIVDGLESNDPDSVNKITEIVNINTSSESYGDRRDNYEILMKVIP